MAVRIRLQRHGKKGRPFYYIVAADARSKRDGRYIERIGSYNPNTNPAIIDLDLDRAVTWLGNGAETSDTAKAILSYKGAMYRHHLNRGVAKGALTEEQAAQKFEAWAAEKEAKINAGKSAIQKKKDDERSAVLAKETEIKNARTAALAAASRVASVNFFQESASPFGGFWEDREIIMSRNSSFSFSVASPLTTLSLSVLGFSAFFMMSEILYFGFFS